MYIPEFAQGIPGAQVAFRATLTATTNKYLAPHLPLDGLVDIGERDIHGNCTRVLFMPEVSEGQLTSFVSVPDAEFTFRSRV